MSFMKLNWESEAPRTVLVIKKINDSSIVPDFVTLIDWLINTEHIKVAIEWKVLKEKEILANSTFNALRQDLLLFQGGKGGKLLNQSQNRLKISKDDHKLDLIMTLGGDGTLLYTASLFPGPMPPVVPFCHGSLGFLTPHRFQNFQKMVANILTGQANLTLRSRLKCDLSADDSKETFVMNEVVISRGPLSSMCYIDLHLDGQFVTSIQGDGLILSTPTGSTAYAASSGSSLVHPSVPGILIVPICPHSLSFRSVVVPAGVDLRISMSTASRDSSVFCSFDGQGHQQLKKGQYLTVTTSPHPVPCVAAKDPNSDWFSSLKNCLQWNERKPQKHWEDLSDELGEQCDEDSQSINEAFVCEDWNTPERSKNERHTSNESLAWSGSDSGNGSL